MRRYMVFGSGLLLGLAAAWAGDGAVPPSQPTSDSTSQPASAPGPQELERARQVFRQLLGRLTDADRIRIERLIAQLGAESWKDRDKATEALKNEPFAALPLIRQAADSKDPEIAERAGTTVSVLESKHLDIALSLRRAIAMRKAAKDAAVVGDLIALLQEDNLAVRNTAWVGVLHLTGQDFGYLASTGPDQSRQAALKAQEWWEKNKTDFVMEATAGSDEMALDLGGGVKLELVLVPAGKFMMGSPKDERNRSESEGPQHEVTISRPFYMAIYPVTQEQYERIIGKNPAFFKGAQNPVENVNWDDAVGFCKKLSQKTGKVVSLPTEAQWEYACRAGSMRRFCYGDDNDYSQLGDYSWYRDNSGGTTHPVGKKKPNDWGLYDMHGNVWQWCSDWYDKDYNANAKNTDPQGPVSGSARVLRDGGWSGAPELCRSAARGGYSPGVRNNYFGFRVSVELPADQGDLRPSPATQPATPRPASMQDKPARPAGPKLVAQLVDEQGKQLTNESISMMPLTVGCPQARAGGPYYAQKDGTVTIESVSPGEHRYVLRQNSPVPTVVTLQVPPGGLQTKVVVNKGELPGGIPDMDIRAKVHEENGKRTVDLVISSNKDQPYELRSTDLQLVSGDYRIFPPPSAIPTGGTVPAKSKGNLQFALDWDDYVHNGLWVSRRSENIEETGPAAPAGAGLAYYRVDVCNCYSRPIELPKLEEFRGRVIDHAGKGVSGATVYLASNQSVELCNGKNERYPGEPSQPFNGTKTVADKDGRFALTGVGGDRLVVVAGNLVWLARMQPGKEQIVQLPQPGKVTISYDIEGAAKEGVFRLQLKTWNMPDWGGVVQASWYLNCKNGGTLEVSDLPPGVYDVWRNVEMLVVGEIGEGGMLDRCAPKIEAGKTTKLGFVRTKGGPISGQVVGLKEAGVTGAFVKVRPEQATGIPFSEDDWKLTYFDSLATGPDGQFKTSRIAPGTYMVTAEAYKPQARTRGSEGILETGIRLPDLLGKTKVVVPEDGQVKPIRIEFPPQSGARPSTPPVGKAGTRPGDESKTQAAEASVPKGSVKIDHPNWVATFTGKAHQSIVNGNDKPFALPADTYTITNYTEKGEGKSQLVIRQVTGTVEVAAGKTVDIKAGEPLTVGLSVEQSSGDVAFNLDCKDVSGSPVAAIVNAQGSAPPPPRFMVFDSSGKQVYQATMAYG